MLSFVGRGRGEFFCLQKREAECCYKDQIHGRQMCVHQNVLHIPSNIAFIPPSDEKNDDSKDSFYEELEQFFFRHFPKCHMKILLGYFNARVGRENIFKPTIGNESLH